MKKIFYILTATIVIMANIPALTAAEKSIIYVKNFTIDTASGLKENDPVKNEVKNIIQDEFEKDGRFSVTADQDISAMLQQEAKSQSFGKCSSESCIQELMEKIKAQVIVFGRIRKGDDGYTYITARYMDSTSGIPKVTKIRTIKYKHSDDVEKGSKALARYLITGKDDKVIAFMDEVYNREEDESKSKNIEEEKQLAKKKEAEYNAKVEKAAKERKNALMSRSPRLRAGYGFFMSTGNKDVDDVFKEQSGYFLDIMFARGPINERFNRDCYFRFIYKKYGMNDDSIKSKPVLGKDAINDSTGKFYGMDFGFRLKINRYFMLTAFDPYALAGIRTGWYTEKAKDKYDNSDLKVTLGGYGGYVGGGMEFAFFENLGFFGEYNRGIFKIGKDKTNIEGNQFYGGVTLRTEIEERSSSRY